MANTFTAANPSRSAIKAQIDQARHGDTVKVLGGTATWLASDGPIPVNQNILIQGAGPGSCTIIGPSYPLFVFTTTYSQPAGSVTTPEVQLTGFTIVSNGTTGGGATVPFNSQIEINGYSQNIRIDHIEFRTLNDDWKNNGVPRIHIQRGWTYGVIDHCTWYANGNNQPILSGHGGWPATVAGVTPSPPAGVQIEQGDVAFTDRGIDHWATAKAWYAEDCVFLEPGQRSMGTYEPGGAYIVGRHLSSQGSVSGHGNDTTGPRARSYRSIELYNVYYDVNDSIACNEWRGASGHTFNCRFKASRSGGTVPFAIDSYRACQNYGGGANSPSYNSSDGTGLFDINDRRTVNIFTGTSLPQAQGAVITIDNGRKPGADANNKPCIPEAPYGTIFAFGTGATSASGSFSVTLPNFPYDLAQDQLAGYVLRDADYSIPTQRIQTAGAPHHWVVISRHPAKVAGTISLPFVNDFAAGGASFMSFATAAHNWELRRVLHVIDEPGTGKTSLVKGDANTPFSDVPFFAEWDYVYQWGNQLRTTNNFTFTDGQTLGTTVFQSQAANFTDNDVHRIITWNQTDRTIFKVIDEHTVQLYTSEPAASNISFTLRRLTATWDSQQRFMDSETALLQSPPITGVIDWWGPNFDTQQQSKSHFRWKMFRNGLRTVGYNTTQGEPDAADDVAYPGTGSYPVVNFTALGLNLAQRNAYRRIGADVASIPWLATDPSYPPTSYMAIEYNETTPNNGQARVPSSTTYWGYQYPHPLVSQSIGAPTPIIDSASNTTFIIGNSGQTFQVTTQNFSASPTFALSNISGPGGASSLPSNVSFSSAGLFSGSATGATVGDYQMTITASHSPDTPATQSFLLTIGTAANQAPVITLTAPANGAAFSPTDQVTLTASASDLDAGGAITLVQFFDGLTSLGNVTSPPYSLTQSFSALGPHSLTAKATDNGSPALTTTSAAVQITIQIGPPAAPSIAVLAT